jgi:hypothetical protein
MDSKNLSNNRSQTPCFKHLKDAELVFQIKTAVIDENKAKTRVLHLMADVERRRLYSREYPSLFEYCVRVLKYSSGAAQRRIDTMRAMRLIPEIEDKIISGELNMTTVSQAQTFFRNEAKQDKDYSIQDKRELLGKLENKSTRECIETLISISPQSVPQERRRELTPDKTELKVCLSKDIMEKLDRLKGLMSHKNPHMTDTELIGKLADMALQKLDPSKKLSKKLPEKISLAGTQPLAVLAKVELLPAPEVKPKRYISAAIKRAVWERDQGQCTFKGCHSKYFLEIDHIQPVVLGGLNDLSNLRLLCRNHNQRAAIESLGFKYMSRFINRSVTANPK